MSFAWHESARLDLERQSAGCVVIRLSVPELCCATREQCAGASSQRAEEAFVSASTAPARFFLRSGITTVLILPSAKRA